MKTSATGGDLFAPFKILAPGATLFLQNAHEKWRVVHAYL